MKTECYEEVEQKSNCTGKRVEKFHVGITIVNYCLAAQLATPQLS